VLLFETRVNLKGHNCPRRVGRNTFSKARSFVPSLSQTSAPYVLAARDALQTAREVAKHLGVCRDTLYELCAQGELPHVSFDTNEPRSHG